MNKELSLTPSLPEMEVYQSMAKTATQSQFFNKLGGESGILSIMLMARELGIAPMQAVMGGMNVIQGKVEISPRMMNSMIRKAGHKIEILESSDDKCSLKGIRSDTKESYTCSFTMEDARKAQLIRGGGGYEKWASDMLFARCLSRLARRLFADIISTAYIEGEIEKDLDAKEPVKEETKEVVEIEVMKEVKPCEKKEIPISSFVDELRAHVGNKYDLLNMKEYIDHLKKEKNVSSQKIMEQALDPLLTDRFCNSWQKWYNNRQISPEEELA